MRALDGKVNILLVDDQPARLLSYETILEGLGQNLVRARSGLEALEKLMKDEFAVVLLDVSMPGMDGFETAGLIHEHPRFERTPIIFVTGVHITELDRLKGYKLGAVDYVSIPVVPEILRSKVAVLVELHCQRRELQQLNHALEEANTTLQAEKTRELEAMNRTLKEADRHKDEFLAVLAHELRNPLAPIRNAAHVLRMVAHDEPRIATARDIIDRQVAHMTRLIDDLLDVSRITRSKIELKKERLLLRDVIENAVEASRPVLETASHTIAVNTGTDVWIEGDRARLVQVLTNLLTNAAKFTPRGGHVTLLASRIAGGGVAISVRDTGVGIPKDAQQRIFDLFQQENVSLERTHGGLGIGLTLVKRLVEMHGGTVSVASEGMGKGTEFTITLPVVAEVSATEERTSHVRRESSGPMRVLVVEDNEDAAESFRMLLELNGHVVRVARDGVEGLRAFEEFAPEVAFVDLGLPGIDGFGVAERVRAIAGRHPVLVAISGYGRDEDKRRALDAGFDAHMTKPVDHDRIEAFLREIAASPRDGRAATVH